jgi:thioredoxin-related protein
MKIAEVNAPRPYKGMTATILACALALAAACNLAYAQQERLEPARQLDIEASQAAASGRVLMVLFAERDCPWCERARREFLLPMQRNAAYRAKLSFRQIDIDSDDSLRDFAGKPATTREFARRYGIKMVPTVMIFGPGGEILAEPLAGYLGRDYYGAFLDERIDSATARTARK